MRDETPVYRDLDQTSLDFQYDNQAQVADPQRHTSWYPRVSAEVRERVRCELGIPYGPLPVQRLDVFLPEDCTPSDRRPVVVFVHGGAWRNLDRSSASFGADVFTARGALYVAVGFSVMPAAGTLDEMVAQVRTALAFIRERIGDHGGDTERICLIGHSSGAHLAAMASGTDWPRLYGMADGGIRGAVLISGIYDLEPVRLSYRNELLKLDRAAEIRNSPCRNLPVDGPPLMIACAEHDTAEFKRQAQSFHALWQRRFGNASLLEVRDANHFETIESVIDPGSPLSRSLCAFFGI